MHKRTTPYLISCIGLLCLAGNAMADAGAMDKDEFKAAEQQIEVQHKAARKACDSLKGNARDICVVEVKGKEGVAKARLEAEYQPSPQAQRLVKDALADADYDLARERCDDAAKGKARKACVQQAKAVLEAALRQAKVEKVDRVNGLKAKGEKQRKSAARQAEVSRAPAANRVAL
ncbi:MAG: hypothetical protein ABWZ08_14345 [Pseudoxanthomonas sp.]